MRVRLRKLTNSQRNLLAIGIAIVGKEHSSRGDFAPNEDDNVLVHGVSNDEGALGYFGYAYYAENKDKLKLIPIDDDNAENGAGQA